MERFLKPVLAQAQQLRGEREFAFSAQAFDRARTLIYRLAGISMSDLKQDLVYGRLVRRLRATGLTDFNAYLDLVESGDKTEREAFINALTTNLTSFFREPHHFPMLAEHARKRPAREPYRVWCAASSTGEEPYSIAITLAEALPASRDTAIIASDVDTEVLNIARRGVYPKARVQDMDEKRLHRFFQCGTGTQQGRVRVRRELVERIDFRQINLLEAQWQINAPFDVIFCRNVMIYFDKQTQRRLLERFYPLLRADGLLICGHSESLQHQTDLFRYVGRTVYAPVAAGA